MSYTKELINNRYISLSLNARDAIKEGLTDVGLDNMLAIFIRDKKLGEYDGEYHHIGASFKCHYFVKLNEGVKLSAVKKAYKIFLQTKEENNLQLILDRYPTAITKEEVLKIGGTIFPADNPTYTEVGCVCELHYYIKK